MKQDDDAIIPTDSSLSSERPPSPAPLTPQQRITTQQAAANVVRSQIDSLYSNPNSPMAEPQPQISEQFENTNPYDRTHDAHPQPNQDQWKQYHSAWQTYYQKYYEGYYTHHLENAKKTLSGPTKDSTEYFVEQPDEPEEVSSTKEEALFDLRQKLLSKVQDSANKVRRSRHFVPIAAALVVILVFSFLQYNRVLIANVQAYVSPGSIDPQNIVVDPTVDVNVSPDPRLIIPKINVDVPAIYGVGNDYNSQMKAMEGGVAHFAIPGASSRPGQVGNTVLSGHSSNDILDAGDYKFIFAQLEKLKVGDSIYANYEGKRYTYTITKTEVVKPTEVSKLTYPTDKPVMTLITCTPLGTALNRLLVTAEQVNPSPNGSVAAPAVSETAEMQAIPGNSPTFFERIFGR